MSRTSRIGRASEVTADGPLAGVPGNTALQMTLAQIGGMQVVHSAALAVNQAATSHFVVPFNAEIVGGTVRIMVTQTTANGSLSIERNGTSIGSVEINTADTAPTIKTITVGAGGTISATDARLNAGDVISFSRPDTGAAGVAAASLVLVPRA